MITSDSLRALFGAGHLHFEVENGHKLCADNISHTLSFRLGAGGLNLAVQRGRGEMRQ